MRSFYSFIGRFNLTNRLIYMAGVGVPGGREGDAGEGKGGNTAEKEAVPPKGESAATKTPSPGKKPRKELQELLPTQEVEALRARVKRVSEEEDQLSKEDRALLESSAKQAEVDGLSE